MTPHQDNTFILHYNNITLEKGKGTGGYRNIDSGIISPEMSETNCTSHLAVESAACLVIGRVCVGVSRENSRSSGLFEQRQCVRPTQ